MQRLDARGEPLMAGSDLRMSDALPGDVFEFNNGVIEIATILGGWIEAERPNVTDATLIRLSPGLKLTYIGCRAGTPAYKAMVEG